MGPASVECWYLVVAEGDANWVSARYVRNVGPSPEPCDPSDGTFSAKTTAKLKKRVGPTTADASAGTYAKGQKFIRDNKEEAVKICGDTVRKRGGKLTDDMVRVSLFDTERYGGVNFSEGDLRDLPATRDFLMKEGKLKGLPPFDQIIDQSFAKKAEAALTH